MSQKPVKLIPLVCVKCGYTVPARPEEVAWVCEQCGQGLILDEAPAPDCTSGARALDEFISARVQPGLNGRPYWVSLGQVSIARRETYKGNEEREARQFWASPRLFYVPAWQASLDEVVSTGVALLRKPETMEPGGRAPFLPVVTLPVDMQALAEFMVMSIEADRRDALKRVDFTVSLQPPQLWILP
jgi:hypothetical protein